MKQSCSLYSAVFPWNKASHFIPKNKIKIVSVKDADSPVQQGWEITLISLARHDECATPTLVPIFLCYVRLSPYIVTPGSQLLD